MKRTIIEIDRDEVEGKSVGVYQVGEKEFLAITYAQCKTFKTEQSAVKWFKKITD